MAVLAELVKLKSALSCRNLSLVRKSRGGMGSVGLAQHLVRGTQVAVKFRRLVGAGSDALDDVSARPPNGQRGESARRPRARMSSDASDEPYSCSSCFVERPQQRAAHGPLPSLSGEIIAQICEALAHPTRRIVHATQAGELFVVAGTRRCKLIDFGIRRPWRSPTSRVDQLQPDTRTEPGDRSIGGTDAR